MSTPEQNKCYLAYNKGLRDGVIVRPDACEICGCSKRTVQGHHKDYSKPLDVEWLCSVCHGEMTSEESRKAWIGQMGKLIAIGDTECEPIEVMFTATQIAKEIGIEVYTARYRLDKLREGRKIRADKVGNTWSYFKPAVKAVENFED